MIAMSNARLTRDGLLAKARPYNAHALALSITKDENEALWLAARQQFNGGSDAFPAAGLDPYKSRFRLYGEKRGTAKPDTRNAEQKRWGNILEDAVAREFSERTGLGAHRVNAMLISREHSAIAGNIDRRVVGENAILEVKTTNVFAARSEWDADDADNVPMRVQSQAQTYMKIGGWDRVYVAVLVGGQELRIFTIDRDENLIAGLVDAILEFDDFVRRGIPPPPITYAEACQRFPQHVAAAIEATPDVLKAVDALREAKNRKKQAEAEEDAAQFIVAEHLGECDELRRDGKTLLTWRSQSTTRLDSTRLKDEDASTWARFSNTTTSRVMRLMKGK